MRKRKRCAGRTTNGNLIGNGEPFHRRPMKGSKYCYSHDPKVKRPFAAKPRAGQEVPTEVPIERCPADHVGVFLISPLNPDALRGPTGIERSTVQDSWERYAVKFADRGQPYYCWLCGRVYHKVRKQVTVMQEEWA